MDTCITNYILNFKKFKKKKKSIISIIYIGIVEKKFYVQKKEFAL